MDTPTGFGAWPSLAHRRGTGLCRSGRGAGQQNALANPRKRGWASGGACSPSILAPIPGGPEAARCQLFTPARGVPVEADATCLKRAAGRGTPRDCEGCRYDVQIAGCLCNHPDSWKDEFWYGPGFGECFTARDGGAFNPR